MTVAALVQQATAGPPELAAETAAELVRRHRDADIVVLPELWLSGYDPALIPERAIATDAPPLGTLREAAHSNETAVIAGFAERRGGAVCNSLALIDESGGLAGIYRKVHLFGAEQELFEPGESLLVAELAGLRVGPMICFDMEFCEPARALARAGAELLVTASANMDPFYSDHLIASQARALDNRLPHLYVNRCGGEAGLTFVGGTRAIRADGSISDAVEGDEERVLVAEIEAAGTADKRTDYLAQLREDLPVLEPTPAGGDR